MMGSSRNRAARRRRNEFLKRRRMSRRCLREMTRWRWARCIIAVVAESGFPHDVSIIGFDDMQQAAFVNPSLTSVHLPLYEAGALACERLIERIRGKVDRVAEVLADASGRARVHGDGRRSTEREGRNRIVRLVAESMCFGFIIIQ